jgi:hypothetical protein
MEMELPQRRRGRVRVHYCSLVIIGAALWLLLVTDASE